MKRIGVSLIPLVVLAGCGADGDVLQAVELPDASDLVNDCTYCELETVEAGFEFEAPAPSPQMVAMPNELGFFGGIDSEAVSVPRPVIITNETNSWVQITNVYIVDAESFMVDSGDAQYFAVETPSLEEPLGTGDSLELAVSFVISTDQRGALLVIETTHPAQKSLVVALSGKIFIGW